MRAKSINEDLSNVLKPKNFEEITKELGLDLNDDPNTLLIAGINKNFPGLITYSINKGANQLWWKVTGPQGGSVELKIPEITEEVVRITNITGKQDLSFDYKSGFYGKTSYNVVYKVLWTLNPWLNSEGSSKMFWRKYEPVDFKKLDMTINNINAIKKLQSQ